MKDKIQIALLSVIAVALVALAVAQFTGKGGGASDTNTLASAANTTPGMTPASNTPTFDPMAGNAEKVDNTPKTTINFGKMEHDFGSIKQDSENKYVFTFTNTGTEPLIIENATGSCGCTVPNYPKEPIPPGGTGDIEVVYKPGKQENVQNKTVTVTANTEPKETLLKITANVQKDPNAKPETPATKG